MKNLILLTIVTLLGTGMGTAMNAEAVEPLMPSQDAEAQGSCYGYQPSCYGRDVSCCICNSQGYNCKYGCCSR